MYRNYIINLPSTHKLYTNYYFNELYKLCNSIFNNTQAKIIYV